MRLEGKKIKILDPESQNALLVSDLCFIFLNKQRFGFAFACAFPVPPLTDPHLQARALRFFMPDKSSTTMSGTRCEWSAAVKTSN